jgi:hypothetical protein
MPGSTGTSRPWRSSGSAAIVARRPMPRPCSTMLAARPVSLVRQWPSASPRHCLAVDDERPGVELRRGAVDDQAMPAQLVRDARQADRAA